MSERWTPEGWRGKPVQQMPIYPDSKALADVEAQLATFPPLVFAGEARNLKKQLARVAAGEAFLLQGGDCAESFAEHGANNIRDFFRVFLQMAVVLTYAGALPVVKVGRVAGQFAKPRSSPFEKKDGLELPSYRGDIVNDIDVQRAGPCSGPASPADGLSPVGGDAEPAARLRNRRLCQPWQRARVDARLRQGFDAVAPLQGTRGSYFRRAEFHARLRPQSREPSGTARDRISTPATKRCCSVMRRRFTRVDSTTGDWYATSGHMLWIGDRTRQLDHAHVEYFRGIKNPIGLKCGPSLKPDELLKLIDILNPDNEPGRLTLINRFGSDKVGDHLPGLIRAVQREGRTVVWSCDPMHGNTITSSSGYKTRPFDRDAVGSEVVLHDPRC